MIENKGKADELGLCYDKETNELTLIFRFGGDAIRVDLGEAELALLHNPHRWPGGDDFQYESAKAAQARLRAGLEWRKANEESDDEYDPVAFEQYMKSL